MAPSDVQQRPRRFAKACDACYRSKIKCVPSRGEDTDTCYNCDRRKLICTRTEVDRKSVGRERKADHVTKPIREVRSPSTVAPGHAPQPPTAPGNAPAPTPSGERGSVFDSLDLTEYYFDRVNHAFPIVNKELLVKKAFERALQPPLLLDSERETSVDFARISKQGSLALAEQMRSLTERYEVTSQAKDQRMRAFLSFVAVSGTSLIMATPCISTIEALVMWCSFLLHRQEKLVQASSLLAVAVRHAQSLRLHVLNQVEGLSALERLARIRLFWCLYILDKELSLRLQTPPLMDDRDLFVLEPRGISDDRLGLVTSLDGAITLNLFSARQRLARVQSQVWSRICSFAARHAPDSEKATAEKEINAALTDWRDTWLAGGEAVLQEVLWPRWVLLHLARLQVTYFTCLLLVNPLAQSTATPSHKLLPTMPLLDAARNTFVAGRLVRHGGAEWLAEVLDVHIKAAAVLWQAIVAGNGEPPLHRDFTTIELWSQVSEQIADPATLVELNAKMQTLAEVRKLAKVALGLGDG